MHAMQCVAAELAVVVIVAVVVVVTPAVEVVLDVIVGTVLVEATETRKVLKVAPHLVLMLAVVVEFLSFTRSPVVLETRT